MKYILILLITFQLTTVKYVYAEKPTNYDLFKKNAELINNYAHRDSSSWELLAELCDRFGPRLVGSDNLEKALDWSLEQMQSAGFSNAKKEAVDIFKWTRKYDDCRLMTPWEGDIPAITLGESVGTSEEGITAEVIPISSKEDLENHKDIIKGKIVLFDEEYKSYGHNVKYRIHGADWASKYGAIAVIIRPVTPHSFQNPHTGIMRYEDSTVKKIPIMSITDESANLLRRMWNLDLKPTVKIFSDAHNIGKGISYNVMCEFKGTEKPEEIIAIGGHIDSWDAGISAGATDDGAGCIATFEAVKILKVLNLKPKRTIRVVFWVDEEMHQTGGKEYAKVHGHEPHFGLFEFDSGALIPTAIGFSGPDSLFNVYKEYSDILKVVNENMHIKKGAWGVDIRPTVALGYPAMNLSTKGDYFLYHHSQMDTPDHVDPKELNDCVSSIAIAIYIYSNL